MGAFLTYALDEGGALVHVDDVAKGAKCACHCPQCNATLYAKNAGIYREHHFAHAHGYECEGAYESSLHLLAKEILQETGRIMLPEPTGDQFPSGPVRIRNVEIEKWDARYGIRPDAEGIMDNGERLLIEFYFSHKVDGKKRQIIADNHLKCIEIDINYQALSKKELKEFLTNSDRDRKWVSSPTTRQPSKGSSLYLRNPIYNEIRDLIMTLFNEGSLTIYPFGYSQDGTNKSFNLCDLGYDKCVTDTRYLGFKSDLLIYRNMKRDKGYISINIRGRDRSYDFRYPKGLRIIDLIINRNYPGNYIKEKLSKGDLVEGLYLTINYYGFNGNKGEKKKDNDS